MFNRSSLLFTNYSVIGRICLCALLVVFLGCFSFTSVAPAQTPADKDRPQTPGGASSGQTFAPIGESGYRVPIPEIKMKNIIGGRPSKEAPAVPPEQKRLPEPSAEPPRAGPMPKEVPAPQVPRLPFEHRQPVPKAESAPIAPAKKETEEKDYRSPLLKAPVVPEDFTAALPSPKKEVLPKTATPGLPTLMDVAPVKETLKPLSLDRTEIDDMADPRLWIRLDPRREAGAGGLEPAPGALGPKEEIRPRPLPEEPARKESIQEPIDQRISPKEGVPREEEPSPPAKESIPSPFDPQAATDPAVASYLKATAPILEELSLVMAKTPSLTVADYDPSEANAPVFPKELVLKLDSVKRELQVLDSKTFEIIPPPRYVPFHSLIRQSITQTYQACDEIINYFNDKDLQSIQKVREHLLKARELIQRTREQTLG